MVFVFNHGINVTSYCNYVWVILLKIVQSLNIKTNSIFAQANDTFFMINDQ